MMIKFLFAFFLLGSPFVFSQERVKADHIEVSVLLPEQLGPHSTTFGFYYEPEEHWHIYWKNPGDSGSAPKFDFEKIEGAKMGGTLWPRPHRLPIGDLTNLGYPGNAALLFEITPEANAKQISVEARLEWLVCNEGECVPGFGTFKFQRPVGEKEVWDSKTESLLATYKKQVPKPSNEAPFQIEKAELTKEGFVLQVSGENLEIFPVNGDDLLPGKPVQKDNRSIFKIQPGRTDVKSGFVIAQGDQAWEWTSVTPDVPFHFSEYLGLLFFAFLGGMILNFMPCVLPVLSIKLLSLVKSDKSDRLRQGLLYSAGVITAFAALGAAFLLLRSLGAAVGWGFHLQSPLVVLFLVLLFWVMGFYFLGTLDWGESVMNWAGNHHASSSFMTGLLSVFVAAPCTGPFMGSALGAAATLPSIAAFSLFLSLGLGLAFPFLLLVISPRTLAWLPKPGMWMEKLKQFFAFPLFATALWLMWVLQMQVGPQVCLQVSAWLLGLCFFYWLLSFGKFWKILALICMLASTVFVVRGLQPVVAAVENSPWQKFSPEAVSEARKQGQSVFIDFTAAWCITCQLNKKAVLDTEAGQAVFKKNKVKLFRADWTHQDPIITQALSELGRNSVPVYVFYPSRSDKHHILSQILTLSEIENVTQAEGAPHDE